jgi:Polyketide cyclase / dehydrase and lipid transport
MRIVKWVLGIAIGLTLVLLLGGLLLSSKFSVSRSVSVNAPAEKIYPLVASPKEWKRWSVWNQRDRSMKIEYFGPESGAGAGWSWQSASEGDGKMTLTAADAGQRVAFDLFFPDFGTTSRGEFRFVPAGAGTKVTWSMEGDMGTNPLFHWFALFADRMVGKDFEGGLANLKVEAEKP